MITIVRKNLLSVTEGIILHGVNCKGVMGAGLALQIRNKYPQVYEQYHTWWYKMSRHLYHNGNFHSYKLLGNAIPHQINDKLWIISCFTQDRYGRGPFTRYTDYEAVAGCMEDVLQIYNEITGKKKKFKPKIAFPKIGAGLGGGDWVIIKTIIEQTLGKELPQDTLELYDLDEDK